MNPGFLPHSLLRAALLAALLFLPACSAVYVTRPVGEPVEVLKPEEWNGVWAGSGDFAGAALVTNAGEGRLQVAEIQRKNGEITLDRYAVQIRKSGDRFVTNIRDPEATAERYLWAQAKIEGGIAVIWIPSPEAFRALVRSGKLKGTVTPDGDVILEPLPPKTLRALVAGELGPAFDHLNPIALRRVAP
jgi:hypothetical protein